jgi:hypothetical protein
MSYYEAMNFLVLHGGKSEMQEVVYKDFYYFDLFTSSWCLINIVGVSNRRSEHSSVCVNNRLYIFGGTSETEYCGSDFLILDFDSLSRADSMIKAKKESHTIKKYENLMEDRKKDERGGSIKQLSMEKVKVLKSTTPTFKINSNFIRRLTTNF